MMRLRLILILCLLFAAQPCGAGVVTQKNGAATLEIAYDGDTRRLELPDLVTVTLTVEGSPALKTPIAPLALPANAPWLLVERSKMLVKDLADPPRKRYQLVYRFAPREPGAAIRLQFPAVKYREGDGAEQIATWTPLDFTVVSRVANPDRAPLRDITAIETMPPVEPPNRSWQWWLAGGALTLLLAVTMALAYHRWRRRAARSPAEFALYEWHRLIALRLPETGRSERFITLLTTLVRRYLERQFGLPARRLTTPEFTAQIEQFSVLTAQEKQFLTTFLQRCEAVKFAKEAMSAEECGRWAESAREFLQERAAMIGAMR